MVERDYYEVIGVASTAADDEIKDAYRKMALLHHPDRNAGSKSAEEKFKEVVEAWETLGDSEKRKEYDDKIASNRQQYYSQGGQVSDRQYDVVEVVVLTLEQVANGVEKEVIYYREVLCSCNKEQNCVKCNGLGKLREKKIELPHIEPGSKNGTRFTCLGKGSQNPSTGKFGSLILVIQYATHHLFSIRASQEKAGPKSHIDLDMELTINVIEFILKGSLKINTLYSDVAIKVSSNQINNGIVRIKKHGLPDFDNTTKGDLYITLKLHIPEPDKITAREKRLLELLMESKNFKPKN